MALYVNTNVSSLNGRNKLNNATNALNTTYQRLSSGLRINSAKDDSAGLQISDRLTTQINGLNQGNRNTSDGIALMQTMEGALDEMGSMLQRIRTLAVQSANGTNTKADREAITAESDQLGLEITRIANQTTFGGQKILVSMTKGSTTSLVNSKDDGSITFQVGANSGDTLTLKVNSVGYTLSAIISQAGVDKNAIKDNKGQVSKDAGKGVAFALSTASNAQAAISEIDKVIAVIDKQRGNLGAMQNRMESTIRNQSNISMNTADARARIRDADFAEESANLTQQNIIQQAASSMLMQSNMRPQMAYH